MKRFICLALFTCTLAFGQQPATSKQAAQAAPDPDKASCSAQLATLQVHAAELQQQVDELRVQLQLAVDPGVMRQRLHNLDALELAKASAKGAISQTAAAPKQDSPK